MRPRSPLNAKPAPRRLLLPLLLILPLMLLLTTASPLPAPALPVVAAGAAPSEAPPAASYPLSKDALRSDAASVFLLLSSAEDAGADVDAAASSLNQALALIGSGSEQDLMEAASIIQQVNSSIPGLMAEGEAARGMSTAGLATTLATLAVAAALVYLFMPRLVWRIWTRGRRDWKVSAQ